MNAALTCTEVSFDDWPCERRAGHDGGHNFICPCTSTYVENGEVVCADCEERY